MRFTLALVLLGCAAAQPPNPANPANPPNSNRPGRGIAGNPLTTADVKALAAGQPVG